MAKGTVVFTPSRETDTHRITSYDDTFVLDYAAKHGGVVVTRDNYRYINSNAQIHHDKFDQTHLIIKLKQINFSKNNRKKCQLFTHLINNAAISY